MVSKDDRLMLKRKVKLEVAFAQCREKSLHVVLLMGASIVYV